MYCSATVKRWLILTFLNIAYLSNGVQGDKAIERYYRSVSDSEEAFYMGNLQFTANFFNNTVNQKPGESVIVSPYSALLILCQLALYANGKTLEQILNASGFSTKDQIREAIPVVLGDIKKQKKVNFELAQKVYGDNKTEFSPEFETESKDLFESDVESLDFKDTQAAADTINSWVAEKTDNRIKDLISSSMLRPGTELVLVNALYFVGQWSLPFDPDDTAPKDFYVSKDKTIKLQTMSQKDFFPYTEDKILKAKALELPFNNKNWTYLIILPNARDGVQDLVSKLVDPNLLNSIITGLESTPLVISLPKFISTSTISLKEMFEQLHITDLFNPASEGLKEIRADHMNTVISDGIQKANIELTESGLTVTAASGGIALYSGMQDPIIFNADHPFIYYLLFKKAPIFCGLYAGE